MTSLKKYVNITWNFLFMYFFIITIIICKKQIQGYSPLVEIYFDQLAIFFFSRQRFSVVKPFVKLWILRKSLSVRNDAFRRRMSMDGEISSIILIRDTFIGFFSSFSIVSWWQTTFSNNSRSFFFFFVICLMTYPNGPTFICLSMFHFSLGQVHHLAFFFFPIGSLSWNCSFLENKRLYFSS